MIRVCGPRQAPLAKACSLALAIPKALPDWKKDGPKGSRQVPLPKELMDKRQKLVDFMALQELPNDAFGRQRVVGDDGGHKSNQFFLQCLDHTLAAGVGLPLSHFRLDQPWRPLRITEQRYYVAIEDLPGYEPQPGDAADRKRSCVYDSETDATRIEVPLVYLDGLLHRPALHAVSDEGPVGAPALWALFSRGFIRGTRKSDPWHKLHRLTQGAVKSSGLWVIVLEFTIVFNLLHAPWGGDAFYWTVREAAGQYLKVAEVDDPLFAAMYEDLCACHGGMGIDFGTAPHMQKMLVQLRSSPVLARKGDHVRLGRWMSFFREADTRSDSLMDLLLFLIFVGYRCGFWKHISQSPLFTGTRDPLPSIDGAEDAAEVVHGVPAGTPPTTVRASNSEIDKLRKGSKNMLELACTILGNKVRFRLLQVLRVMHNPIRSAFAQWQTMGKTQLGALEMHFGWCVGHAISAVATSTLQALTAADAMDAMRFCSWAGELSEAEVLDETYVSERAFDMCMRLTGNILVFGMQYSCNLPHMLVLLIHPEECIKMACLERLKTIWEWLDRAFVHSRTDGFISTVVKELEWTQWDWVMSLLALLSEVDFTTVLPEVAFQVRQFARSLPATHINEDAFGVLQEASRQSPNKQLAPQSQWHRLATSRLAAEYDRPPPIVTEAAKSCACTGKIPKTIFNPDSMDFSMTMEQLPKVLEGYTSPSPERAATIPMCLQCCLSLPWAGVKVAWLSLLMKIGCVVVESSSPKSPFMVLHATRWGCMLWPLQGLRSADGTRRLVFVQPVEENRNPWVFRCVSDIEQWTMVDVKVVPPACQKESEKSRGLIVDLAHRPLPLLKCAARHCFPNMLVAHLKKLMPIAKVEALTGGRRAMTEADICKRLLETILPEESPEGIKHILAKRLSPEKLTSVLFDEDNLGHVENCVDEFDRQEFEEAKHQHAKAKKKHSTASAPSGAPRAEGGPSASSSGQSRPKISLKGSKTPDAARAFIPQVAGCSVREDTVRHMRWSITYTGKPEPPFSISRSYGDQSVLSREDALKYCLRVVWQWHADITGAPCPFDLGGGGQPLLGAEGGLEPSASGGSS